MTRCSKAIRGKDSPTNGERVETAGFCFYFAKARARERDNKSPGIDLPRTLMEIDKELVLVQNSERSRKSRDFCATAISSSRSVFAAAPHWSLSSSPCDIGDRHEGETFLAAVGGPGFDQVFSEVLQYRLVAKELRRLIVDTGEQRIPVKRANRLEYDRPSQKYST